ncbi:ERMES complex subunit mmm1 [Polyrhizophydium stewartii]|uniref:Maintenance of mitochondrial morphology protein 1 n=1 Tax=Polyrhizophydium stewartii TaxID=2732419 RepID=A0ABR4N1F6_9FUNG
MATDAIQQAAAAAANAAAAAVSAAAGTDRTIEAAVQLANKEFIKGFIAGQVILFILIFFLFKVFLLRNSDETRAELARRLERRIAVPRPKTVSAAQRRTLDSLILGKIGYDPAQHPFESCGWFNTLVAQLLATYRTDAEFLSKVVQTLDGLMNNERKPSFVGPISITDFSLGEEYPVFKNARVRVPESESGIRVQVDFSFDDQITLGIETQMLINWPKPGMASLPISLALSIVKFSGTLMLEFVPEPLVPHGHAAGQSQTPQPQMAGSMHASQTSEGGSTTGGGSAVGHQTSVSLSILDDFLLEFEVRSLLGHRTKVKDLPKLTSLICNKLRSMFVDELVWPSRKLVRLPNGQDMRVAGAPPASASAPSSAPGAPRPATSAALAHTALGSAAASAPTSPSHLHKPLPTAPFDGMSGAVSAAVPSVAASAAADVAASASSATLPVFGPNGAAGKTLGLAASLAVK